MWHGIVDRNFGTFWRERDKHFNIDQSFKLKALSPDNKTSGIILRGRDFQPLKLEDLDPQASSILNTGEMTWEKALNLSRFQFPHFQNEDIEGSGS